MDDLDALLDRYKLRAEAPATLTDDRLTALGVDDAATRRRILDGLAARASTASAPPPSSRSAWEGRWKGDARSGDMRCTLTFTHASGKVQGSGADRHGAFRIDGTFTDDAIRFLKRYGAHEVAYEGALDLAAGTMKGTWFFGLPRPLERGTFSLQRVKRP